MDKKKIIGLVIAVLTAIILLLQCYMNYKNTGEVDTNKIGDAIDIIVDELNEINKSTTEIPNLKEEDEEVLEVQEKIEIEGLQFQGDIAYEGDYLSENIQLGGYAGLTYYSQVDGRWKNHAYTSIGDKSQIIGTSGCGPTSAAMVVSSIKGTITPDIMADLFVQNKYRSANNGTYLAAFRWVADFFNIEYNHTTNLDTAVQYLKNNNYIIASCGSGLFTYGGHLIVIVKVEGNMLQIYDPYLYSGKFDTSTRKGKVTVSGNTVYCSIDNFRKYANATNFYCYKNDRADIKENNTNVVVKQEEASTSNVNITNYKVKITAKSGLNIRRGASTSYAKVGGYSKNTTVTILAESNGWGKTDRGWINLAYTTKIKTNISVSNKAYTLKSNTKLYTSSSLSVGYSYIKGTKVTLIDNVLNSVAKVKINKTGLIRYVDIKYLK